MEPGRALHLELCHPDQRCCSAQVCMPHSSMHRVFGQSQLAKPGFPIGVALPAGSAQVRGREPQQRPIVQKNVATHHPGQIGSPVCCGPPFFQPHRLCCPGKCFPCMVFLAGPFGRRGKYCCASAIITGFHHPLTLWGTFSPNIWDAEARNKPPPQPSGSAFPCSSQS